MQLRMSQGTPIPVTAAPEPKKMLRVDYASQRPYRYLCWAACAQMVLSNFQINKKLCEVVSTSLGHDCCRNLAEWDNYQDLDLPYKKFQFIGEFYEDPFKPSVLIKWLDHDYIIQIYFEWGHTALIVGYYDNGDFEVYDPWYESGRRTFSYILSGYRHYDDRRPSWTATYYRIEKHTDAPSS